MVFVSQFGSEFKFVNSNSGSGLNRLAISDVEDSVIEVVLP